VPLNLHSSHCPSAYFSQLQYSKPPIYIPIFCVFHNLTHFCKDPVKYPKNNVSQILTLYCIWLHFLVVSTKSWNQGFTGFWKQDISVIRWKVAKKSILLRLLKQLVSICHRGHIQLWRFIYSTESCLQSTSVHARSETCAMVQVGSSHCRILM
jgi:hypothetical protein